MLFDWGCFISTGPIRISAMSRTRSTLAAWRGRDAPVACKWSVWFSLGPFWSADPLPWDKPRHREAACSVVRGQTRREGWNCQDGGPHWVRSEMAVREAKACGLRRQDSALAAPSIDTARLASLTVQPKRKQVSALHTSIGVARHFQSHPPALDAILGFDPVTETRLYGQTFAS